MSTDTDYKVHGTERTHDVIKSALLSKKKRRGKQASGRKKRRQQAGNAGDKAGTDQGVEGPEARPEEDHAVDYYA